MRAETFGLGITATEEAVFEALALMASVELLAGRDPRPVRRRRIEVEGADLGEVEHGRSAAAGYQVIARG